MKNLGYPVEEILPSLIDSFLHEKNVVLTAQPGAGKSTIVPLHLIRQPWLEGRKILILQPRRIAAISVANRMSELFKTEVGQEIGFVVRHYKKISANTRIQVITEGLLTRMIQSDPFLEDIGMVILDEFHERSIHSDLCLALCKEIQNDVRPDLKILVMSATLESEPVSKFLGNCRIVKSAGFLHDVQKVYQEFNYSEGISENAYKALKRARNSDLPDKCSLVFLPGRGEIEKLREMLDRDPDFGEFEILPLHGGLTLEQQKKVLDTEFKSPRIILSTNIAETSLTIDSVSLVIDSGYCRTIEIDPSSGIEGLKLKRISRASADQRAGRAGRVCAGKAIRLWSLNEHQNLKEFAEPDILRLDLAPFLLEVFLWGCSKPEEFNWFQSPSENSIRLGVNLLNLLGAIDANRGITQIGRKMASLPVDPRLARMILFSEKQSVRQITIVYAALLSEKSFYRSKEPLFRAFSGKSDLRFMFDLYLGLCNHESVSELLTIDKKAFQRVKASAAQIASKFGFSKLEDGENLTEKDFIEAEKAILAAFPDRVGIIRGNQDQRAYKLVDGAGYRLANSSLVKDAKMVVAVSLDKNCGNNGDGKIFCATEIASDWIDEVCSHLVDTQILIRFDNKTGSIVKERAKFFQSLIIESVREEIFPEDQASIEKILGEHVLANLPEFFSLSNDNFLQLKFRVDLLKKFPEGSELENFDEEWIKIKLPELLIGCRSVKDLRLIDLPQRYLNELSYAQQKDLDRLVPTRFSLPSGNSARIIYQDEGSPLLNVKLQEMFGQSETPTIVNGRQPLLIQLLSPAGRPLQLTQDLKSFWVNGYPHIAKEMKGRYLKHPWPENPSAAVPFGGTKRQFARKNLK